MTNAPHYKPNGTVGENRWWTSQSGISSVFSINEIEALTGLDFFSEIPDEIEESIEAYTNHYPISGVAPLMAALDDIFPVIRIQSVISDGTSNLSPAGQDRIPEQGSVSPELIHLVEVTDVSVDFGQISSSEIRLLKQNRIHVDIVKDSETQIGEAHKGSYQAGGIHDNSDQCSSGQIGTVHINQIEVTTNHDSSEHPSILKNYIVESDTPKTSSAQVYTSQINIFNNGILLPTFVQPNTSEISLSSSVTLQQFLSSHNFNLQNTTIPTWTEFLTGTTPFNLNIEITDRPTGQLAEANITRFDPTGRPTSGTLTLDTNGLGWF